MESQSSENHEKPLLTFNALYNILRTEKKESTLQQFPDLFYEALEEFIKNKKEEIKNLKQQGDNEKLKKEHHILKNSTKIAKEIINIRAQKIAKIACQNSLFDEEVMEESNILEKEKKIYEGVEKNIKQLQKNL